MRRWLLAAILVYVVVVIAAVGVLGLWYGRQVARDSSRDALLSAVDRVALGLQRSIDEVVPRTIDDLEEIEGANLRGLARTVIQLERSASDQGLVVLRLAPDGEPVDLTRVVPLGRVEPLADLQVELPGLGLATDLRELHRGAPISVDQGDAIVGARAVEVTDRQRRELRLGNDTIVVGGRRDVGPLELGGYGPRLAVALVTSLLLGAALAVLLAHRLARPVRAAEHAARQIAAGDLSVRVDTPADSVRESAALIDAVNQLAVDLREARQRERTFLAAVSHELKTPLTSIQGFAELVGAGALADDTAVRDAGATIGREADRLSALVEDLLSLARLDADRFRLHPSAIDLAEVVADQCAALRPWADEVGITVSYGSPDTVPAHHDPVRVAQIVRNLLQNALDVARRQITVDLDMADRLPPTHRVVEPTAGGTWAVITVTDDGPGVAGDIDRIFERFEVGADRGDPGDGVKTADGRGHSGDGAGRRVGSGLGLAVVRELVTLMDGGLGIATDPAGTTVWVALPAR